MVTIARLQPRDETAIGSRAHNLVHLNPQGRYKVPEQITVARVEATGQPFTTRHTERVDYPDFDAFYIAELTDAEELFGMVSLIPHARFFRLPTHQLLAVWGWDIDDPQAWKERA